MKDWEKRAVELFEKSINPFPQELNELDWKVNISEDGKKIARHLSALSSNREGGFLVFGVDNNGSLVGLKKDECTEIIKKIGNVARDTLEPAVQVDHMLSTIEDKELLFVYVKESTQKPVHIRSESVFESYIRSAGQTRKMTKQEVSKSISRSSGLVFEEQNASDKLSGSEVLSELDFSSYFDLSQKSLPKDQEAILEVLVSEHLVKKEDSWYYITNMGAILFAKDLQQYPTLKRHAPRVVHYATNDKSAIKKQTEGNRGYASGFVNLVDHVNNLIPSNEIITSTLRKEVKMYPELALRELIANALIHQDFDMTGTGPMIEIFSDRIEIRNPGAPLIKPNRLLDLPPQSRNEMLARMMRRLRVCEELGLGIDKVVEQAEIYQLPAPSFEVRGDHFVVTLWAHRELIKMTKEERIRACYQHASLRYVMHDPMDNKSLRKRFNVIDSNYPIIWRIISDTLAVNQIKKKYPNSNSRKYAKYLPFWG